jgi:hypothetical protein
MRKLVMTFAGSAAVFTALACDNPLAVKNKNNPDVARAYATPGGIEAVISATFQQIFSADIGSSTSIMPALMTMAFENASPLGNFNMGVRSGLPRVAIQNTPGNASATENFRDFSNLTKVTRAASNGVVALDKLIAGGGTIGSAGANARAYAFAHFTNGVALGNLALAYDSAAVVTPSVVAGLPSSDVIPPLAGYKEVMAAAIQMLDSAVIITNNQSAGFPLPATWINTSRTAGGYTAAEFIRIARSYKARFLANVARNKADRDAADWTQIITDATNGIQSDLNITLNPSSGWTNGWINTHFQFGGWHQMSPMIIGMADTSGAYNAYMATAPASRAPFLIQTPDKRFPAGATRALQQTASNSANRGKQVAPAGLYIINRQTGDDIPGDPSGTSYYDHYRYAGIFLASGAGDWPIMTKAEIDMLAAEGHIRKGAIASAVPLINTYRVAAGLPPLDPAMTATAPVPGGNACVPRAPIGPSNGVTNTPVCGTVFEAMKWEKRMETAFTGWGQWFFDSRGWGDLPEGTPVHYPVPYQETDARGILARVSVGGVGNSEGAAKGTYGY